MNTIENKSVNNDELPLWLRISMASFTVIGVLMAVVNVIYQNIMF